MSQQNPEYKLEVLGNKPRKTRFDENLAEQFNKQVEEEERLARLKEKREKLKEKLEGKQPEKETPKLITPPSNAFFLTKELYEQFEDRRKTEFPDVEALAKLNYNSNTKEVTGSNSFIACYVNKILKENRETEKLRTATQADLEKILKNNFLKLKGHYEDTSLVLRSEEAPNEYLAKHLMKQVKKRLGKNLELPLMIPLYGLEIEKDDNSPHKLAFNLTDNSELIYAPILNEDSGQKFSSDSIDEKTGLPKRLGEGERYFYTRKSGLSRFYLATYLGAYSYYEGFSDSVGDGRVVVVSPEGAEKI